MEQPFLPINSTHKEQSTREVQFSLTKDQLNSEDEQDQIRALMAKVGRLQKSYVAIQKKYLKKIQGLKSELNDRAQTQASLNDELKELTAEYLSHRQEVEKVSKQIYDQISSATDKSSNPAKIIKKSVSPRNHPKKINNSPLRQIKKSLQIDKNHSNKAMISASTAGSNELITSRNNSNQQESTSINSNSTNTINQPDNHTNQNRKTVYSPSSANKKNNMLFNSSKELNIFKGKVIDKTVISGSSSNVSANVSKKDISQPPCLQISSSAKSNSKSNNLISNSINNNSSNSSSNNKSTNSNSRSQQALMDLGLQMQESLRQNQQSPQKTMPTTEKKVVISNQPVAQYSSRTKPQPISTSSSSNTRGLNSSPGSNNGGVKKNKKLSPSSSSPTSGLFLRKKLSNPRLGQHISDKNDDGNPNNNKGSNKNILDQHSINPISTTRQQPLQQGIKNSPGKNDNLTKLVTKAPINFIQKNKNIQTSPSAKRKSPKAHGHINFSPPTSRKQINNSPTTNRTKKTNSNAWLYESLPVGKKKDYQSNNQSNKGVPTGTDKNNRNKLTGIRQEAQYGVFK